MFALGESVNNKTTRIAELERALNRSRQDGVQLVTASVVECMTCGAKITIADRDFPNCPNCFANPYEFPDN